uniref:NADH-ubiquinone oxidoreductase chain 5 n=1 Tax=Vermamoeba vermiformis TaxID=5778 RepID=D4PBM0_VERVE|nr:NADH dehydrogenase subunit 5 [Vermamoeba vermiformis]ADD62232.1 NADH dehydrogenase subunit 5 [Vermamoeba vermiformis]
MYLLVLFLPLLSFFVISLFGRYFGREGSSIIAFSLMLLTTLIAWFLFFEISVSKTLLTIELFTWLNIDLLDVKWGFLFDSVTSLMLIVVTTISFFVHLYSISYMGHDPHLQRFLSYLSLFTFFMLILVTADNFLQMFVGWEGVGLASYLLISFWFTRLAANKSAIKAMVVNRVGDIGVVLAMLIIYDSFKTLDYGSVFALVPYFYNFSYFFLGVSFNLLDLIALMLFIGVAGKSAQIGLHVWLPDAMEGPTPVSALIHAATMVTAGVFILVRASVIFEYSNYSLNVVAFFGALTAFLASTVGVFQNDVKRVIAYSTCSQLGYMVLAAGMSLYFISFFHLFTHAFFKALLFLGAGSVIHALGDEQDMRRYGGTISILPFSYILFWLGSLALMGFPFLAGFYSKDLIIEFVFSSFRVDSFIIGWLAILGAFFTAFYSFKVIYLTFIQYPSSYRSYLDHCHDAPVIMYIPLLLLSFLSIFSGFVFKDIVLSPGSGFWSNATSFWLSNSVFWDAHLLSPALKLMPLFFSLAGCLFSLYIYKFSIFTTTLTSSASIFNRFYSFFNRKWYFDNVYNDFLMYNFIKFGYLVFVKSIDKGVLEFFGPLGLAQFFKSFAFKFSNFQSGLIYHYAFVFLVGLVLLLSMFAFNISWIYFIEPGLLSIVLFSAVVLLVLN